ncbi:MAG TPA: hypothetical protein VF691_16550 [Cytophagaceae bacterium]|jgi:hypothetical protein
MEEREIKDSEGITWKCIQAFSGGSAALAEKANELADNSDGQVTVVCTPSGAYQTVRLELSKEWMESMPEEDLLKNIEGVKGKS